MKPLFFLIIVVLTVTIFFGINTVFAKDDLLVGLNPFGAFTPLQQYKKGIDAQDVICKEDLQLIVKSSNGHPACVKPTSMEKLIEREWASLPKTIMTNNAEISIHYLMDGGNIISATVYGVPPNKDFKPGPGIIGPDPTNGIYDFIFSLQTTKDGKLAVTIPREITGSIAGEETVLIDGMEIDYPQIISPSTRTLIIDFTNGTSQIEIIGSGYYKDLPPIATLGLK